MKDTFTPDPNWVPIVDLDFFESEGRDFHAAVELFRETIKDRPRNMFSLSDGWHTITSQMAEQLLMRNTHNRPLAWDAKDGGVLAYGTQMINKRWKKTGQPVIINSNGEVEDAGHRLWACYLSGAPFDTYVVNVAADPDLFAFIDNGRSRSGSDALTTAGVPHLRSKLLAQIIRKFAIPFDDQSLCYAGRMPQHPCTNIDVLDYMTANPTMSETVRMIDETYPAAIKRLVNRQAGCFIGWKIYSEHGPEVMDRFFTDLNRTDLASNNPVAVLQNRLDSHVEGHNAAKKSPKRKMILTPTKILALSIRAFNAWIAEQTVRRLDPRADDTFPEFVEAVEAPLADAAE
jgi:hypothetical protein